MNTERAGWRRWFGWALVLVAPAVQLGYIRRYAVNVTYADEWAVLAFLRVVHERGNWWPWLFRQHNEHRVASMRLVLAPLAELTDWSVVAEMYLGFALQLVALAGLWRVFAAMARRHPERFAPVAWLSFGLIGYTIFLYGMLFVWNLMLAAVVWTLWLVSRQTWPAFAGAAILGLVASFTINNGLLVWPLGVVLLWLGRERLVRVALWAGLGVAIVAFYYHGYVHPVQHPPLLAAAQRPLEAVTFLSALLGAAFGFGSYKASCAIGAAVGLALLLALRRRLASWREWDRSERVMFCLLLFSLASAAAVTVSRVALDRGFAVEPRYTSFTILAVVGLYFYHLRSAGGGTAGWRWPALALALLLAMGFTATSVHAHRVIVMASAARHSLAERVWWSDRLSNAEVALVFHDVARMRGEVGYMRARRLGLFAGARAPKVEVPARRSLIVERWREGTPLAEIRADRAVVQRLRCPVDTLLDLAVPFATHGRSNSGHVELRLERDGAEVGRTRVAAASIPDNGWVTLALSPPLADCAGSELVLTVASEDALAGGGVTVWTYPAYYEGELQQGGAARLSYRTLGLEMNHGRR